MRIKWIILIISLLLIAFSQETSGYITKLHQDIPPDPVNQSSQFAVGQWVKYQIKRYAKGSSEAKPRDFSEAELKISIVDKKTIEDKEFFWVEFLINEDKEQQRVVKFMIDQNGKPYPAKLILKYGNLEAVEIELRRWAVRTRLPTEILFEEMTQGLNIIPFTRTIQPWEKVTEKKITINLEGRKIELECLKVSIKETEAKTSGHIWYSDQVPLAGLVKFFLKEQRFHTLFLLADYGTSGGRSVITETPKKLNFRE